MCEVIILFNGYSKLLENGKMEANCTCTLIKGPPVNVIVDTMTAWDRDRIVNALITHNIQPEDINYVVCTHSHSDHIGNNNLFTNAVHIVGSCIQKKTIFDEIKPRTGTFLDGYQLCEAINVIRTPGHTYDDVTVLVSTEKDGKVVCFAITGDLFEKQEDIEDPSIWQILGIPELQKKQAKNRLAVSRISNYIVPGHGITFEVTDEIRNVLKSQTL